LTDRTDRNDAVPSSAPHARDARDLLQDIGSQPESDTSSAVGPVRATQPNLPPPLSDEWGWQLAARCLGFPPEVFFPEDVQGAGRHDRELEAKAICRHCPVLDRCREHALRVPETYGVWGAMTAGERMRIRTSRRNAHHVEYLRARRRNESAIGPCGSSIGDDDDI
jgi:WhiB family transcriptional regulator, redox-sensing transcriptional regulator